MPKKILTETSKPGFQPWNHEEFLADRWVKRMSSMERKTYATLLHEAFFCSTRPYLPSDEEELEVLADCDSAEEWLSIRDNVLKMFERIEVNGAVVLCSKRVEQDWERMLESRNLRSTRAKTAAQARHKQAQADQNDAHACQVRERVIEEKELEQEKPENEDGQDDMNLKKDIQLVCAKHGMRDGCYSSTWSELKNLTITYSVGQVVRDFESWMEEMSKDDFRHGPVAAYLHIAHDRLSVDSAPARAALKDPEVISLIRSLTHLSGGSVAFENRHKIQLAEVLGNWTAEEITAVFKTWLDDQDLNNTAFLFNLPNKFVQIVDSSCYSLRQTRIEKTKATAEREQAVRKLQEQAETERLEAKKLEESENDLFDPLS